MVTQGGHSTRIRVLAIAGAFAVAMFTSAATSSATPSAAPGSAAGLAQINSEVVGMPSAVAAARRASAPMDGSGERHVVPGMEMDKPAGAPEVADDQPADAHEHGATASPTKAPASGGMPGMDMPAETSGQDDPAEHGDAGGHGDATEAVTKKPLLPVLGTFGGGTAAVMFTAAILRRKDRERLQVRQAARAAARGGK